MTLGEREKDDVLVVIDFLRSGFNRLQHKVYFPVSVIGLWGRSMGAVTALFHSQRDPSIAAMVLDSPFANLNVLCIELASKYSSIPTFVTKIG